MIAQVGGDVARLQVSHRPWSTRHPRPRARRFWRPGTRFSRRVSGASGMTARRDASRFATNSCVSRSGFDHCSIPSLSRRSSTTAPTTIAVEGRGARCVTPRSRPRRSNSAGALELSAWRGGYRSRRRRTEHLEDPLLDRLRDVARVHEGHGPLDAAGNMVCHRDMGAESRCRAVPDRDPERSGDLSAGASSHPGITPSPHRHYPVTTPVTMPRTRRSIRGATTSTDQMLGRAHADVPFCALHRGCSLNVRCVFCAW